MVWDLDQNEKPSRDPVTTYGPFACRAIPKIIRKELKGKSLIVFSGGLPRSSGSDKYTVSVIHDDQHVAFDFTSKVRIGLSTCFCKKQKKNRKKTHTKSVHFLSKIGLFPRQMAHQNSDTEEETFGNEVFVTNLCVKLIFFFGRQFDACVFDLSPS